LDSSKSYSLEYFVGIRKMIKKKKKKNSEGKKEGNKNQKTKKKKKKNFGETHTKRANSWK